MPAWLSPTTMALGPEPLVSGQATGPPTSHPSKEYRSEKASSSTFWPGAAPAADASPPVIVVSAPGSWPGR